MKTKEEIIRICPKCKICGIKSWQFGDGYGVSSGEIVPQDCPSCGEWLNQPYWGNVKKDPNQS